MRTEEEQVEAIKSWWKENGRSTVIGVVIAVVAVFGWRGWQDHQVNTANNASALYQTLVNQASAQQGQTLSDEQRKSASFIANQLKTDYESSSYAQYAALWLAKLAAEQGQVDQAKTELNWVLQQEPEAAVAQVVNMRLAQLMLASGEAEAALKQLGNTAASGFEAGFYELRGDLLVSLGRHDEARKAYQSGLDANTDNARPLIALKLDDLTEQSTN
ncbi:MAG: tetratricopeptide repeat protein [Motiliproteus sp.]